TVTADNSGTLNGVVDFVRVEGLTGGAGSDTFIFNDGVGVAGEVAGGAGVNLLNYAAWTTPVTVDLELGIATGTGSVRNVQNVQGGQSNALLRGDGGVNVLQGGAGDDVLVGLAGDDRLFGGAGRDLLSGGGGTDFMEGGEGEDLLIGSATVFDRD